MVSVGDLQKTGVGRLGSPRSKSKQFTILILSLGLMVLMIVYKTGSPAAGPRQRSVGTTHKLVGSFVANGSDQRSVTTNNVGYGVPENDEHEGKIRQISLIGERNSGTRWTWHWVCRVGNVGCQLLYNSWWNMSTHLFLLSWCTIKDTWVNASIIRYR